MYSFVYVNADCEVNIRNITIVSGLGRRDGRCLDLDNCSNFAITNCSLRCDSDTSDMSPYPHRWRDVTRDMIMIWDQEPPGGRGPLPGQLGQAGELRHHGCGAGGQGRGAGQTLPRDPGHVSAARHVEQRRVGPRRQLGPRAGLQRGEVRRLRRPVLYQRRRHQDG